MKQNERTKTQSNLFKSKLFKLILVPAVALMLSACAGGSSTGGSVSGSSSGSDVNGMRVDFLGSCKPRAGWPVCSNIYASDPAALKAICNNKEKDIYSPDPCSKVAVTKRCEVSRSNRTKAVRLELFLYKMSVAQAETGCRKFQETFNSTAR